MYTTNKQSNEYYKLLYLVRFINECFRLKSWSKKNENFYKYTSNNPVKSTLSDNIFEPLKGMGY